MTSRWRHGKQCGNLRPHSPTYIIISTPCSEDGACENRAKDSPTTTQGPASTSSNSGPRQVNRAVAHVRMRMPVRSTYAWALMMRIPGGVRRVLKFQRTRQRRHPPWPNSLGKCPSTHLIRLSPPKRNRQFSLASGQYCSTSLHITFASHTSLLSGSTDPRPSTHLTDHIRCILHCCFLTHIHLLLFSLFSWFTLFPMSATKVS